MKKHLKKDIFISYRREDGHLFAHLLAQTLAKKGYSVFYDREDLVVGSVFPEKLTQAVSNCNEFIPVITPMYFGARKDGGRRIDREDDWVRREISLALQMSKRVLPIIVDPENQGEEFSLPGEIAEISRYNFLKYDHRMTMDEFVVVLEKGFSEETVRNCKYNTLLQELYEISDETDNDFNIKIRNFVICRSEEVVEKKLIPLIEAKQEPEDVCFAAYYAVFTYYRRLGYAYKIHDLVERFAARFSEYRFQNVALSQHYSLLFELAGKNPEALLNAVRYARAAAERIPENTGVMQNYADLITKSFELGVNQNRGQLQQAIDCIHRALAINPKYPKYHCTLGRLLSFKKQYHEAIVCIQKAINLENMETKDSFIRIVEYHKYITDIKLRQLEHQTKKRELGVLLAAAALWLLSIAGMWIIMEWRII